MTDDVWALWKRWVKDGKIPDDAPVTDGFVCSFFGHTHDFKPVAVWQGKDGKWAAKVGIRPADPARTIEQLLNRKKPGTATTHADYLAKTASGTPFPKERAVQQVEEERGKAVEAVRAEDQAAGVGHNQPPEEGEVAPEQALYDEIVELGRTYRAEEKRVAEGKVSKDSEDTYQFFSQLSAKALALFQKGDSLRKIEKAPHWEMCQAVDKKWARPNKLADDLKKMAADMTLPYHEAKRKAQAIADAKAQANRDAMSRDSRLAERSGAGVTGTKVRRHQLVEVEDPVAFCAYLMAETPLNQDLLGVFHTIAASRVSADIQNMPGIKVTETLKASN